MLSYSPCLARPIGTYLFLRCSAPGDLLAFSPSDRGQLFGPMWYLPLSLKKRIEYSYTSTDSQTEQSDEYTDVTGIQDVQNIYTRFSICLCVHEIEFVIYGKPPRNIKIAFLRYSKGRTTATVILSSADIIFALLHILNFLFGWQKSPPAARDSIPAPSR